MKYEFTMKDVFALADEFAAYMLNDDTLADRDNNGEIVSNLPNIPLYKRNCRTDLKSELFGYMATHPSYASIFPAEEQIINLVIRIFEEFPLAGIMARNSWKSTIKKYGIDKHND